jgi:predicted phage-related endonuclease
MSNAIAFDTLAYAKKLKKVGFTEEQAEVQAEALAQIIDERLATKQDILALRRDMKEIEKSIKELETSLRRDMKEMDNSLRRDMKEMELRLKHDLTIRLGAMLTAGIAIVAAFVKLL